MLGIRLPRLNPRIKSDRINILRKKYDAFLEEDKKRKERNDYILGRLDNMRYYSSAVQARHKPILYGEMMPIQNRGAYRPEQLERREFDSTLPDHQINRASNQNMQMDVQRNFSDISTYLKEITKKYILIPKLRTSMNNGVGASMANDNYTGSFQPQSPPTAPTVSPQQSNIISNEDWKSKYDILEKLKKKENEKRTDKYDNDELYPVKEKQALSTDDAKNIVNISSKQDIDEYKSQDSGDGYALQSCNSKDYATKYEHEVAEKDLTFNKVKTEVLPQNIEKIKISDSNDQEPAAANIGGSAYTHPMNTAYDNYKSPNESLDNYVPIQKAQAPNNIEQNVYESNYSNENIVASEYTDDKRTDNTDDQINEVPQDEQYEQYEPPIEVQGNYPNPKKTYLDPDDYSPIEVLDTLTLIEEINTEPIVTDTPLTAINDEKENEVVYQYPVEMLNVQEYTPADDVKLVDGENVNPKYLANEENIDSFENPNESQAETTNENQVYMASEENTEPVYETEPQVETTGEDTEYSAGIEAFDAEQRETFYNEEKVEYNYDQQQVDTYQDNQDYTNAPAQDYSYYESPATLQEQEYPVEINEHEESNSRYDQNYEQQYATEYEEYVQPQEYNQTAQEPYGQTEQSYQDYEYQQPDNDTAQNIQQALDQEEGYLGQQNYEPSDVANKIAAKQNTA